MVGSELLGEIRLERPEQLLAHVRRVADHGVEAAGGEHLGEGGVPVKGLGIEGGVGHEAVPHAEITVERGQRAAVLGGLDPDGEPAEFDGFFVQVHGKEVVGEDARVRVEEAPLAPQLFEAVYGLLVGPVELLERLQQESAAATGRVH